MKIITSIEARIYPLTATQNDDYRTDDPVIEVRNDGTFRLDGFNGEFKVGDVEAMRDSLTHALAFLVNELKRRHYGVKDMHR